MSVGAITAAFALQGVSPSEKLVLLALANYADENGRSYPSQRRLAADTGLTDRTIRKVLTDLEGRGLLGRMERLRSDGSRSSDIITLCLDAPISGGAEIISGGVRKPLPGGAETASALTTFEPSSNPEGTDVPSHKARKATRRCPADWSPSVADLAAVATEGFSPGEIDRELAKIRDHHFRTAHSDWSAVFRNWIRGAAERRPRLKVHTNDRPSPLDQRLATSHSAFERAAARRAVE